MRAAATMQRVQDPATGDAALQRLGAALRAWRSRPRSPERLPPSDTRLRQDIGLDINEPDSECWGREAAELYLRA